MTRHLQASKQNQNLREVRKVHGVISGHFDRVPPCKFRSETILRGLGTSSEIFIRGSRSDVPMFRFLSENATQWWACFSSRFVADSRQGHRDGGKEAKNKDPAECHGDP